ncbi:MAG: RNA polymerase sigma factor [Alphaproteobacteria bacterium]
MTHRFEQDALYHELALTHGGAMMRLARLSEAEPDKRHDLIQIMNVELWKSLAGFDGQCSQKTWVYRVIHNVAASYVQKESRRNSGLVYMDSAEIESIDKVSGSAHESTEHRDALTKLYAWIRRLDMPDRQIISLYLEDISTPEIAEMIGLSSGAVATRISRLKSKLSRHFEETSYDKS